MMASDFYTILDLQPGATPAEVRRAYRKAALRTHPDKGGTEKDFHSVALAFEALSSAAVRVVDHGLNSAAKPRAAAGKNGKSRRPHTQPCSSREKRSRRSSQTPVAQALAHLQAVLQLMDAQQRRLCLLRMAANVRSALLQFMKHSQKSDASRPTADTADELPRTRVRKSHIVSGDSRVRAAGLCTVKIASRAKYKVQVYANALRLYTAEQTEVETAIEHHIMLVRIKNAIVQECNVNPLFWQDPQRLIEICTSVVQQSGIPEEKLGLRVFAVIKAGHLLAHDCRITTRVAPLAEALETYCRILRARATSWESFRAEWISLLCSKHLTREAAEAVVDGKRMATLDLRLKQAQRMVEEAIAQRTHKAAAASRTWVGASKRSHVEKAEVHGSSAKRNCDAHRCGGG